MSVSLDSLFVVPVVDVDVGENASLEQLAVAKSQLEQNLSMLFDHLQQRHRSDMDTPLLTPDGFPRADIDVLQVRMTRSKIIMYRNDLAKVLRLIDAKLIERFATAVVDNPIQSSVRDLSLQDDQKKSQAAIKNTVPFAYIAEIVDQSPAFRAGLLVNDRIIEIGPVNVTNHNNLQSLPLLITRSEDVSNILKKPLENDSTNL